MPSTREGYASYLLRLRQIQTDDGRTWISSMQSTATGEKRQFSSLDKLVQFLWDEFGEGQETEPRQTAG